LSPCMDRLVASKVVVMLALAVSGLLAEPLQAIPRSHRCYAQVGFDRWILLPAYFYSEELWSRLVFLSARWSIMVIANPSNGPGAEVDPDYSRWIRGVSSGGGLVLGYVYTGWASRPLTEVERDVDTWLELYPEVRGFFVDEVSDRAEDVSYYMTLALYIRQKGDFIIVLNPGTSVPHEYLDIADAVVVFEDSASSLRYLRGSAHPALQAAIVSEVPASRVSQVLLYLLHKGIRAVYLTDEPSPPTYARVPAYFELLAEAWAGIGADRGCVRPV